MKVKIVEAGYAGYTGTLGYTEFVDGVSVNDVSPQVINQLSVNIGIVDAKTGEAIGSLNDSETAMNYEFPIETPENSGAGVGGVELVEVGGNIPNEPTEFTREQLEALADKEGVNGLREIGDSVGVKGTSINGLIESILGRVGLGKSK